MTYTINPNAKNVWIRDNENTMDLSPITDASSVYLENGRTIEQELGEGSMVSNVVTVDTSMSKIIDGTLDGAYESCVFKGRTLVNLLNHSSLHTSYYSTNKDGTITVKNTDGRAWSTLPTSAFYFKANTTYTFIIYNRKNILKIDIDATKTSTEDRFLYTTKSDVENTYLRIKIMREDTTVEGSCKLMILEGDYLEEEVPYFTGICDVKMPILRNVGKNLFDKTDVTLGGYLAESLGEEAIVSSTETFYQNSYIKLRKNTDYIINPQTKPVRIHLYNSKKEYQTRITNITTNQTTFNSQNYGFARLSCGIADLDTIQLEESPSPTQYEPYKTNILHTPEIVTLRSLPNGVRDELNLKTGEYIKRIGEVVLNGSESWARIVSDTTKFYTTAINNTIVKNASHRNVIQCDKKTSNSWNDSLGVVGVFNVFGVHSNGNIEIRYDGDVPISTIVSELQSNPITVQYELETPVTTKVTLTQSEPIVKIGTELPNGVCDTYNLLTGEHIQRVGKVVLDGSEAWTKVAFPSTNTTHCYSSLKIENLKMPNVNEKNIVSDRFQTVPQESYNYSNEEMYTWRTGELLYVNILRSRLVTSDVQGLKAWFKENPTTVWYELANPIVTKKNGFPNTYGITLPNGEADKYNESTGVYTQNLGKVVLDGSQDLGMVVPSSGSTYFIYTTTTALNEDTRGNIVSNLPISATGLVDTIAGRANGTGFNITLGDQTIDSVDKAKNYLASNPVYVYYPLATPKTIDIPLINVGQVLPNGVCDTYNPITKEYVKRVSGTVLVGNEDWSLMNSPYETDCIGFVTPCSLANWTQSQANLNIVCEGYVGNYELWNVDEEGFSVFKTPTRLAIKVKRSKLSTADINGFKKFLKLNPLAVWYELATPEVSTVDLDLSTLYSSSPIAYENGHVILESGHDGQSLLPTLEYSTVTNRVKQIESIGEQVLRQEKQLTMLEQMLIQNIIGLDYNNTVLALNLEINEVM